jgi:hypothetical protein
MMVELPRYFCRPTYQALKEMHYMFFPYTYLWFLELL